MSEISVSFFCIQRVDGWFDLDEGSFWLLYLVFFDEMTLYGA